MPTRPKVLKTKARTPRHEPEPPTYGQGRGGRPWRRLRNEVMERDGYLCQCKDCKRLPLPKVAHEVDHVVPLSRGGTDDPSNLAAINQDCHKAKTQRESMRSRPAKEGRTMSPGPPGRTTKVHL